MTSDPNLSLETMTWIGQGEVAKWSLPWKALCLMSDKHSKLLTLTMMEAWCSLGATSTLQGCPDQRNVSIVILTESTQLKETSCVMVHGETFTQAFST